MRNCKKVRSDGHDVFGVVQEDFFLCSEVQAACERIRAKPQSRSKQAKQTGRNVKIILTIKTIHSTIMRQCE